MRKLVLVASFIMIYFFTNAQVVSLDSIGGYIGRVVTVYGKVDDGRYLSSSARQPTLLNMGGKFPNQKLTVVIYGNNRANFGYKPEEALISKNIYITGKVELYKSQPQIIIENPFNIAFSAPSNTSSISSIQSSTTKPIDRSAAITENVNKKDSRAEDNNRSAEAAKTSRTEVNKVKLSIAKSEPKAAEQVIVIQSNALKIGDEITTNAALTLKGGPGNKFNSIGTLKKGSVVKIVSSSYGWAKVMEKVTINGSTPLTGYVKTDKLD